MNYVYMRTWVTSANTCLPLNGSCIDKKNERHNPVLLWRAPASVKYWHWPPYSFRYTVRWRTARRSDWSWCVREKTLSNMCSIPGSLEQTDVPYCLITASPHSVWFKTAAAVAKKSLLARLPLPGDGEYEKILVLNPNLLQKFGSCIILPCVALCL